MKTTDYAFGGQNFFKSRITTEYGTVYVDDLSGRCFLLNNQLNDLTNQGMRQFWQNNGKVFFLEQFFNLTSTRFPVLSTSSSSGVGYISTYDPRFKRLIIHKRDFEILPEYAAKLQYVNQVIDDPFDLEGTPNILFFNNFNFYLTDANGIPYKVDLNNSLIFRNPSFTISYSFLTNSWIS